MLADRLADAVRLGARADDVEANGAGWRLRVAGEWIEADVVVFAVPGPSAAPALASAAPDVSREIAAISHVSTAVIAMIYPPETTRVLADGTGFVVPRGRAPMTACTWLSSKWPDDAFGTRAVVRCYVGAAGEDDVLDADDADIIEACARHLSAVVALPDAPEEAAVIRWPASMPQYDVGHLERVARIRAALPPGIFVVGQAYRRRGHPRLRPRGGRDGPRPCSSHLADAPRDSGDEMSDTIYALYPVFRSGAALRSTLVDADDRRDAAQEVENLFKSWDGRVQVRGTYSTVGFRADSDLMLWLVGSSPQDVQRALVEFRRTKLGGLVEVAWTFMGMVRPAEFTPDHQPAFVKGTPPEAFLCVYPFVRTPEWYLLPSEERGELLREHGMLGREFPEVLANTTSGFGLGDWEWILAFEAERADSLVGVIRALRDTKARLYTKEEIPFVTGIRKPIAEAIEDLV